MAYYPTPPLHPLVAFALLFLLIYFFKTNLWISLNFSLNFGRKSSLTVFLLYLAISPSMGARILLFFTIFLSSDFGKMFVDSVSPAWFTVYLLNALHAYVLF